MCDDEENKYIPNYTWTGIEVYSESIYDLIQVLKRAIQLYLAPARRLEYGLARIIRTPALNKAEPESTQPPQIVHVYAASASILNYFNFK